MNELNYRRIFLIVTSLYLFTFIIVISITLSSSISAQSTTISQVEDQAAITGNTNQQSDWGKKVEAWDKFFSILEKLFTIVAIVIGGIWAYYKFFKGRTYTPRLELGIDTNVINAEADLVTISLQLKNVGLSIIDFKQESLLLRLLVIDTPMQSTMIRRVRWKSLKAYRVFELHSCIEAGETIKDQLIVLRPANHEGPLLLQLRIVGYTTSVWKKNTCEWWDCKVIEIDPLQSGKELPYDKTMD